MVVDRQDEPDREFRLEGTSLIVAGLLLFAGLAGAFWAGRWYERGQQPPVTAGVDAGDPLAHVVAPPVTEEQADLNESLNYFDSMEGEGKQAEPQRQIHSGSPARQPHPAEAAAPDRAPATSGDFYVQVFAGRDEQAAAGLVTTLERSGYSVRLFTEREGSGSLYKVRVGGYENREVAGNMAAELQKQGYSGAWVTRLD